MKLRIILLSVLFILGTFVVPLNIYNSYGDGMLLFTVHRVAGSGDVNTENLIKERCFVHVQIDMYSSHHGPFHRNNPDKTFYPGDAFDYQVTTWKDGCGAFWQPCPIESTPNNTVPNGGSCIKGGTKGPDSDAGTGVIDPDYAAGAVSLSKQAFAEQRVCHKTGSGWDCDWETVTARATQGIPMRLPNLTVDMWTVGEEFTEDDGYTSRNLDGSYYVWDAINVVHNPIYEFKDERVGTIFIEYEKIHEPLVLEDEFFCDESFCVNTMDIPGFKPWTGTFDYGGGNTVYNVTSLDDIGEHEIKYIARLYNIAPQIDEFTQSIDELVVEYFPIYDSYVYPVLSDDERLAFHDRVGIALHYFGSQSTDANPDDEIGIHEDRRSKINDHFYSTWGADPWEFELLDGTVADTDYSELINLIWNDAHDVRIVTNQLPVKMSEDIADEIITTGFPEIIPYEVEQHTTANFLKAGYGKIKFDYPGLLEDVVLNTEKNIPRFENATVFNTLQSSHFAGHDVTHLAFDEYMYPESFFHNSLTANAVDSEGNQDDSVQITLEIMPRLGVPGTQYLDEYMRDKILFDTQDDGFSQIITGLDIDGNQIVITNGHDIYTLGETESTGFGSVSIEKTRRILSSFTQYDIIEDQTFENDDVIDVSDKYLLDTEDAILPIPLTTGLGALSPFTISITGDDSVNEITNTFDQTWYDFSQDYTYQTNMDGDNLLEIKRDSANPRVLLYSYDENFGKINSLQINDVMIAEEDLSECFKTNSPGTCAIAVPEEYQLDKLDIVATNIWNGKSSAVLTEVDEVTLNPSSPDPERLIFDGMLEPWIILVLVFALMMFVIFWIIKRHNENN